VTVAIDWSASHLSCHVNDLMCSEEVDICCDCDVGYI
jgi:hypothetical protein